MGSIGTYEAEIRSQPAYAASFDRPAALSHARQSRAIFTGSGDSLASAMLAEAFSGRRARAADPSDLARYPVASGMDIYVVSVSGNTAAGHGAAQAASRYVAITANPASQLGNQAYEVVPLMYGGSGTLTAGSLSFLSTTLTCISLVSDCEIPEASGLLADAESYASRAPTSGRIYALGNMYTYPVAMYCAAKFYEVTGREVNYSRIEQFAHMEIFAVRPGDTVIIFEEKNRRTSSLARQLRDAGVRAVRPGVPADPMEQVLYCTFFSQMLTLRQAKKMGISECHFITAERMRQISSGLIY